MNFTTNSKPTFLFLSRSLNWVGILWTAEIVPEGTTWWKISCWLLVGIVVYIIGKAGTGYLIFWFCVDPGKSCWSVLVGKRGKRWLEHIFVYWNANYPSINVAIHKYIIGSRVANRGWKRSQLLSSTNQNTIRRVCIWAKWLGFAAYCF